MNKKGKSEPKSNKDKRLSGNRVPIQLLVDYRCNGNYLFDFCRDLGTGGIFIETETPPTNDSEVELTFTIPDSKETLKTKGSVIWIQQKVADRPDLIPGIGVQFTDFTSDQRKMLELFVERYRANAADAKDSKHSA
jgi:uncharacterized protein (TIGR02266 family)